MTIHLFNPLENLSGGSEWRTIEIFRFLKPHSDVKIWSRRGPNPACPEDLIGHIETLSDDHYPRGGNFIFIGCYQFIGNWINKSYSDRTIIIYNTDTPRKLANIALRLPVLGPNIELVYASNYMKKSIGGFDGPVHPSLIDLNRFTPYLDQRDDFTIGRLSRDTSEKHFSKDHFLYDALSKKNICIEIMGGTYWAGKVNESVNLYPEMKYPAHIFMRKIDCFYYRTSDNFYEPSGRVILEAMASGKVVVAHHRGGYSEYIDQGINGFLFKNQKEAFALILQIQKDPTMRVEIGKRARQKVEEIFSQLNLEKMRDFYLG
jgi:glycosyltransferase involved in cell wall biosynthesis